jgi:predicted transcriptional regulator
MGRPKNANPSTLPLILSLITVIGEDKYLTKIHKDSEISFFNYTHKLLKILSKNKLIIYIPAGKRTYVEFTQKGAEFARETIKFKRLWEDTIKCEDTIK